MPTPWKRSPEELHKTYIANTEAFYKVAGRGLAQELDEFVVSCALGLWKGSPRLGQQHVDAVNQLYSKGRKRLSKESILTVQSRQRDTCNRRWQTEWKFYEDRKSVV